MKKFLTWNEVIKHHRIVAGIHTKNRVVQSILVDCQPTAKYPNKVDDNKIKYFVGPNTPNYGIHAMIDSIESKTKIRIFQKLGVNKWTNLGYWVTKTVKEEKDGDLSFTLVPFPGK